MNEGKADHYDRPPDIWVRKARAAVMLIGFAWIAYLLVVGMLNETNHGRDFAFVVIGITFMLGMFTAPILLCSVLLPTYKARLLGSPLILLACFVFLSAWGSSSHVNMPSPMSIAPWILTCIAILVALPEFPPASRLYRWLFHSISR